MVRNSEIQQFRSNFPETFPDNARHIWPSDISWRFTCRHNLKGQFMISYMTLKPRDTYMASVMDSFGLFVILPELLHISALTKLQYITRNMTDKHDLFYKKKEKSGCRIWLERSAERKNWFLAETQRFKLVWNRRTSRASRRRLVPLCEPTLEQRISLCLRTGFRPFASLVRFKPKKRKTERVHVEKTFWFISINTIQLLYAYERKRIYN